MVWYVLTQDIPSLSSQSACEKHYSLVWYILFSNISTRVRKIDREGNKTKRQTTNKYKATTATTTTTTTTGKQLLVWFLNSVVWFLGKKIMAYERKCFFFFT